MGAGSGLLSDRKLDLPAVSRLKFIAEIELHDLITQLTWAYYPAAEFLVVGSPAGV